MRYLRTILPNLSIALQLALATLVILDVFNPRIGLLSGLPFVLLFAASFVCAVGTAVVLYQNWRRIQRRIAEKKACAQNGRGL